MPVNNYVLKCLQEACKVGTFELDLNILHLCWIFGSDVNIAVWSRFKNVYLYM